MRDAVCAVLFALALTVSTAPVGNEAGGSNDWGAIQVPADANIKQDGSGISEPSAPAPSGDKPKDDTEDPPTPSTDSVLDEHVDTPKDEKSVSADPTPATDSTDEVTKQLAKDVKDSQHDHELQAPSMLVQEGAEYLPDLATQYPGCALGYFWCLKLMQAGVSAAEASDLSYQPRNDQPDEWFYKGEPTCVARGAEKEECQESKGNVLVCPGYHLLSKNDHGSAEVQVAEVKAAVDNGGIHPECPSCSRGRQMAHSPTVCLVRRGEECPFECEVGYTKNGTLSCPSTGFAVMSGGACLTTAVDTDKNKYTDIEATPLPSPPAVEPPTTPQDIQHEDWDLYNAVNEHVASEHYAKALFNEACLLLWDSEFHLEYHSNVKGTNPLRRSLMAAAKGLKCDWAKDGMVADGAEKRHAYPKRGDHGPWPKSDVGRVVHVRVWDGSVVAVRVDLGGSKTGRDLYSAVADRMSVQADQFTLYHPNGSSKPIDPMEELKGLNLKLADEIQAVLGHRELDHTSESKLTWRAGAVRDSQRAPIAP